MLSILFRIVATIVGILAQVAWLFGLFFMAASVGDPNAFSNLIPFILPVVIIVACPVLTLWGLYAAWRHRNNFWLFLGLPQLAVLLYILFWTI